MPSLVTRRRRHFLRFRFNRHTHTDHHPYAGGLSLGLPGGDNEGDGGAGVGEDGFPRRPLLLDTRVALYDFARFLPGSPLLAAALHLGAWEERDRPSAFATVIYGLLDASSHGGAPALGGPGDGAGSSRMGMGLAGAARAVSPRHLRSPKAPAPSMLKLSKRRGPCSLSRCSIHSRRCSARPHAHNRFTRRTTPTAGSEMYLSRLAGGASGSSGSGPGSPLPARLGLSSPRNAVGGAGSSTSKSPSFSAARAGLDGSGALAVPGRSPPSLPAPTLSMASTGTLRRLASVAEFRSASKASLAGGADPQQPHPPALLRGASVGGAAGAAAAQLQQQQQLQLQQQGLGRAALRRHNSLVQEEQEAAAAAAAASTTSGSSRGGGSGPFAAPPPPPHPGYYHTIGPGSTLGQRAAGTAAAISRVRKLAGAAMSREGSFLTALSLLGGEDAAVNAAAGGRDQYHHSQLPYASPPTAGSLGLGTPPLPFRSSSVGSNDTHHSGSGGGGGGGGFDPSSPPGVPLLSTSPAPATVIMGPGARAPMGMSASSAFASGGGAGPGGAVIGGAVGGGYPTSGNGVGAGGVGGGRGGWGEPRNRAMAGLIADAREITELCR